MIMVVLLGYFKFACNCIYSNIMLSTFLGYVDTRTAIRLVRNYNIVYRMGLDVAAIETFITANSRGSKRDVAIPLVVDQLSQ